MINKHLIFAICSAVVVFVVTSPTADAKTWLPLQIVDVTVMSDHQGEFVKQLHAIADRMGYAIRIAPRESGPQGEVFVELWRSDLYIEVWNPQDHQKFQVCFYSLGMVSKEEEDAARNDFIEALKEAAKVIPGGEIIEIEK